MAARTGGTHGTHDSQAGLRVLAGGICLLRPAAGSFMTPEISRSVREPKIAPGGHTDDRKRYGDGMQALGCWAMAGWTSACWRRWGKSSGL
jgi:hypothetical protein